MLGHCFGDNKSKEKRSLTVIIITVITMFAEIIYGYLTNSMGLLADGYHMGTHAIAISLTFVAYVLIRKLENSKHFPNGTEKIGTLAAYTSSLVLGFTGFWIIWEASVRLINPVKIQFNEAILVAVIGLLVNILCMFIMGDEHICSESEHINEGRDKDYNFKAAYFHILADALTSLLAIGALLIGKYLHFTMLDPIIGVLGGLLIIKWAIGLIKDTTVILIDMK